MSWFSPTLLASVYVLYLLYKWTRARRVISQLRCPGKTILPYYPFSGLSTLLGPWFPPKGYLGNYYSLFTLFGKYGSTCLSSVDFWSSAPVFWIADADLSKMISSERTKFPKNESSMYDALNIFGENIVTVDGPAWKRHRVVAKPAFNEANNEYVWRETISVIRQWFKIVDDSSKLDSDSTVDLVKSFTKITMCIICSAGFGRHISAFGSQSDDDRQQNEKMPFGKALASSVELLIHKVLIPNWMYSFSETVYIPVISPALKEIKETYDTLQTQLMDLISQSRAWVAGGKQATTLEAALLRNLVEANMDLEIDATADERQLTDRELLSDVFIFLAAGHETSSHALSFAVVFLALYPEVQKKVYDEVSGTDMNAYRDVMSKLTYTQAVFNETLRFFSPTPRLDKRVTVDTIIKARRFKMNDECTKPQEIEEYDVPIPKGSYVIIDTHGLHMNPIYWGEDVHDFKPERFIDTPTYRWPRDAFMAFATGSRRCIGEKFAVTESVCILAHLVREYEILVPKELRAAPFEKQKKQLLSWRQWLTAKPLNAKVVLRKRDV